MGLIPIGGLHHNSKKVLKHSTGQIYDTLRQAAEENGYKRFTLGKMLAGVNSNRSGMSYVTNTSI